MPKVSGREIISDSTEKSFRALVLVSSTAILTKAYAVPLDELKLFDAKLPQSLFDVALMTAVVALLYTYTVKWLGDLAAFRLWYSESSIWSEFGSNMKLDKTYISGGVKLLLDLREQELAGTPPVVPLTADQKKLFDDFKLNLELYASRLEVAGRKFATLSAFGHFYVWFQHFIFPVGLALVALSLLRRYGSFLPPTHI